ncbi:MAG: Gfo/Idh/MocA family oxidoreductase [Saprospiraceae bacterium]|nr:Gfo/Idh/MocA family oxidoreductase [Saprospiraceae bacterium]MBK8512776.1 Gfo/Idh/MocA family oxidoreductase [Saprospiraceae bacterium]MBK9931360.1 Gfo/Idh/MocA family oxidoreductase [Saprospiraceae bacterium]
MKKEEINSSRRKFIKISGSTLAASTVGFNVVANPYPSHLFNVDTLKVGIIGCGGRGSGAALQAMKADKNVYLTAMADVFEDRLQTSYQSLIEEVPDKIKVPDNQKFMGFDAYKKLLETDVDVIILATPPCFRPGHLEAAINAGKHVFFEKPVAVDAPGIRRVMEVAKKAKEKKLGFMSGFCWRHDVPKSETYKRILNGDIGDVLSLYNTYNTGASWWRDTKPSWGKFKKELRNWVYYTWMSGDHITEQAVHSLDLMNWAKGDVMPVKASGQGGRQSRIEPEFGNIFDHFSITYEYPDGSRGFHHSRQQKETSGAYSIEMLGTKGRCDINVWNHHEIKGAKPWLWEKDHKEADKPNMYQEEHDQLFASIRKGDPFNDGVRSANSTFLAIWGRMVAYTGKDLTYTEAINSSESLTPPDDAYDWDLDWQIKEVAKPGFTKFV